METAVIQILGTILVALITSLISLVVFRRQEKRLDRKDETDRAAGLNDMALELIQPYKAEVAELRNKVIALECDLRNARQLSQDKDKRITDMQAEIDGLHREVEALQRNRQ